MRLKLNRTLRAALIAAITAAGFTLPQSFAETLTGAFQFTRSTSGHAVASVSDQLTQLTIPWSDSQSGSFNAGTMSDGTDVTGTWSSGKPGNWQGGAWTNDAALVDLNTAASINLTSSQVSNLQSIGAWGGGGNTTITFTLKDGAVGQQGTFYMFTSSCDFTPTGFGVTGLSNTTITCASATGDGWDNVVTEGAKNLVLYKVTGTISEEQVTFTNSIGKNGWSAGAYSYSYVVSADLTWTGTDANHNLTDAVWSNGETDTNPYSATDNLIFDGNGYDTVTVNSVVASKSIQVQAGEYTFENTGSLTAQNLTVDDGAALNLTGTGIYTVNKAALDGTLGIGTGTTLKVTGADAAKAILGSENVNNSGTVVIGDSLTIDGSLTSKLGGTVAVADGKKLTLGTTKDSHTIDLTSLDALVLGQGANIDTKALKATIKNLTANGSTLKMLDTKDKNVDGVILQGTTTLEGNLTITSDWKYKINIEKLAGTGSLELTGGNEEHRAVIGDANIHSINVTNKMTNVELTGTVNLSGILAVGGSTNVTGENAMTVGGLTGGAALNVANGITFNVAEGGNYSYTGALTVGGQIVKQGVGTQTITGGAGTQTTGGVALHRALDVQAGTLVLNGNFAIDAITDGNIEHKTVNYEGTASDNGFDAASGSMTVYDTHSDAGTLDLTNGHFLYGGADVTDAVKSGNGKYELSLAIDKTVVYVNRDSLDIAKYKEAADAAGTAITRVELKDGTTVNMDAAITTALKHVDGASATVTATEDITLTSIDGPVAGKTLTFSAEGHTVTVQGDNAFEGNIVVDKGTVKLGSAQGARSLGAFNGNHVKGEPAPAPDKTITINEGGTIDLNGKPDLTYVYTLNGGSLVNNGANISDGSMQTTGVKLTDDSFIGGTGNLYLLGPGYDNTTLELNDYTLTKTGTNTLGLRNTAVSSGTLEVQGGTVNFIDGSNSSVEADIVLNGGNIAGNVNMAGDISITTQEDTATNATIIVGDHELTLNTEADKTLTLNRSLTIGEGSVNVTGDGTLLVNCTLNLGDKLTGEGNIAVGASGNLTLTGGSTIASVISNSGSVSLTGLTLDNTVFTETESRDAHFGLNGQVTEEDNYFEGTAASYVQVVSGGTSTGTDLTWGDLTEQTLTDGKIITGVDVIDYDTFHVNADTVKVSDVTGAGHGTKFIEVTGGTLDVDTTPDAPGVPAITVTGEGTLTGEELDVTRVHIDEQAIVHVTDGLVSEGVTFYAAEGGDVSITNTGRKRAYSTENGEMLVQAGGIVKTTEEAEGNVTVSNILEVGEITNTQGGTLTLDGVSEAIEVKNLIIGLAENPAAAVEMLVSGSTDEATVTITEALAAANGTLLANLVMADDSALLVGGVEKALHVGSTLTMGTGIALDGLTLQALDDLAIGEDFWLVDKAAGRELVYTGATGEDAWYDAVFSRVSYEGDYTLEGDFNIVFDDETDSLGLRKFSNTPEPATGTLSLLALAALAARRRKHN